MIFLGACTHKPGKQAYTYKQPGYWYQLISFTNNDKHLTPGYAWVEAVFQTQRDSVFYDTRNEMQDRFFIKRDTSNKTNFLKLAVSLSAEGDSICVLIKPNFFFKQQFKSKVPLFCEKDSVVKVNLKIKKILSETQYSELSKDIAKKEQLEIEKFFGSAQKAEQAKDSLGFYWVEPPAGSGTTTAIAGDMVTLVYSGGFINGRIIDVSPPDFEVNYGTPDQLIKGLNYVIGKLKKGQTSKIILPSQLAFGQNGSSNGSVPPFTPMLYKITITNITTHEAD